MPICTLRWLAWPSRLALLLGIGALSAAGAEAAPNPQGPNFQGPNSQGPNPQSSADRFGELRVWSEDGRIYLAEAGTAARELQLGDTAQARRLRALLQQDGTNGGARLDRMILAGGGGCGFDFTPPGQAADPARRSGAPTQSVRRSGDGTQPVRPMSSAASRHLAKDRGADKE